MNLIYIEHLFTQKVKLNCLWLVNNAGFCTEKSKSDAPVQWIGPYMYFGTEKRKVERFSMLLTIFHEGTLSHGIVENRMKDGQR